MGLTRRIFSRALAVAPAIAPEALRAANISGPVGGLPTFGLGQGNGLPNECYPTAPGGWLNDELRNARDALAQMIAERAGRTTSERLRALRAVTRLDPDLAVNKSLSLSARIRIQAERDDEQQFEQMKSYWEDHIKRILARL